jgi:hypothetical protein
VRRAPKHNGTSSAIEPSTNARCGHSCKGGNGQAERSHEKKLSSEGSSVHMLHCVRRRCHQNRGDDAMGLLARLLVRPLLFFRLLATMSLPLAGDDDAKPYTNAFLVVCKPFRLRSIWRTIFWRQRRRFRGNSSPPGSHRKKRSRCPKHTRNQRPISPGQSCACRDSRNRSPPW